MGAKVTQEIVIRRTAQQYIGPVVIGVFTLVTAGVFLEGAVQRGGTGFYALAAVFLVWSAFCWATLVRCRRLVRLTPDGIQVYKVFWAPFIAWDHLRWAQIGPQHRAAVLAWRAPGEDKDNHVGLSQMALGARLRDVQYHMALARPDLPQSAEDAAQRDQAAPLSGPPSSGAL